MRGLRGLPAGLIAGLIGGLAVALLVLAVARPDQVRRVWHEVVIRLPRAPLPLPALREATPAAASLIAAAEGQVGVTTSYDPAYVRIAFPGGDVPRDTGVCTDVVVRALRDGLGVDLQAAMNRDMRGAFGAYPRLWGLARPDPNIDHRRVPNLEAFLRRMGAAISIPANLRDLQPGDIVTSGGGGRAPHVMIVTRRTSWDGMPLVVHNSGAGTRVNNALPVFTPRAVFRLEGAALARLRRLAGA
ncbi:DUF1287 domain-containing protein [Paracoccus sp. p4-l81]|uniref:DUF1287 domain-containing protein n=1 Tax=unclassified Paracoccus (in: a-proteobacteria) TaxID=2688777 RepID=UPI0035B8F391